MSFCHGVNAGGLWRVCYDVPAWGFWTLVLFVAFMLGMFACSLFVRERPGPH